MAQWSRNKVNSSDINNGNEYEKKDRVSRQQLNAMVNSGLYSQDFAEALTDTPDTSTAGSVGTPSVSFVDNIKNGITYKKFKFSNLKGATGAAAGFGTISATTTTLPAGSSASVTITPSGSDTAKNFAFEFSIPRGQDGTIIGTKQFTYVVDSNAKLEDWARNVTTAGQDYTRVLIKKGTWTTSWSINLTTTGTVCVVGEPGNLVKFYDSSLSSDMAWGFRYTTKPTSGNYFISGVNVTGRIKYYLDGTTQIGGHAFYNCINLYNCTVTISGTTASGMKTDCVLHAFSNCSHLVGCSCISEAASTDGGGGGFYNCSDLINCYASHIYSVSLTDDAYKKSCFDNCVRLNSCQGTLMTIGTGVYGFYQCANLTSCKATLSHSHSTGRVVGFSQCNNLNCCNGTGVATGGGNAYGFGNCYGCSHCFGGNSTSGVFHNCYAELDDGGTTTAVANTAAGGFNLTTYNSTYYDKLDKGM